tara:strand:+ start:723 stop:1610 length:888 start_codon:yes stop_codon:yes gene_type:complete
LENHNQVKKYATIDIGSNAVRLLISNIYIKNGKDYEATKNSLVRVPLRLGQDAFNEGRIKEKNINKLIDVIKAFVLLMKVNDVEKYLAYATSALRCSENSGLIVERIKKKAGLSLEIISGNKEARLITKNRIFQNNVKLFCIIDVGGGSTELTLLKNNTIIKSKSFKIGGVRLMNNVVSKKVWNGFTFWVKKNLKNINIDSVVGFGGNINKIFKLSGNNIEKPMSLKKLTLTLDKLESLNFEEKSIDLNLNPDRLDVIIPAGRIYEYVIKEIPAKEIWVPKLGLADGMVYELLNN